MPVPNNNHWSFDNRSIDDIHIIARSEQQMATNRTAKTAATSAPTDAEVLAALRVLGAFLSGGSVNGTAPAAVEVEEEDEAPAKPAAKGRAAKKAEPEPEVEDEADEEPEDEDEEGEGYDRDALKKMTLAALRKEAAQYVDDPDDLKGYDKDALIAFLMDDEDADEEEPEEDEEADDEDGDEEGDEDVITEDDLRDMSLADLKALAKEEGIKVKPGLSKDQIIDLLLDGAE